MYFFLISLFIRDDISRYYIQMNSKLDSTIYITKLSFLLINIYQDWLEKSSEWKKLW